MKKRAIALTTMLACMLVLCFALVGCGANNNKANFVGNWTLDSMESSGVTMTGDQLSAMGITVTMTVSDDGKGKLTIMGESDDFTWEAKSATEMLIKSPDTTDTVFTLADGKLTGVGSSGTEKMVFKKA